MSTPRLCQLPASSCVTSLCLTTEIRNTINSFSLLTDKTGFLGLPPAKKWVLYGETGSGQAADFMLHLPGSWRH